MSWQEITDPATRESAVAAARRFRPLVTVDDGGSGDYNDREARRALVAHNRLRESTRRREANSWLPPDDGIPDHEAF